jgi:hypothetical protein
VQLPQKEEVFMHLAYLDDSDTRCKTPKWQVMSGVIIQDSVFKLMEIGMWGIQGLVIPPERLERFEEFHACELYGGYGIFEGIEQDKRFEAITHLLRLLQAGKMSVVFGAVDLSKLRNEVYASADPLDISFRVCLDGIHSWANTTVINKAIAENPGSDVADIEARIPSIMNGWMQQLVILIVDECPDKKTRDALQRTYRDLRRPLRSLQGLTPPLIHFHDDMYFGDSRYSIGIQLADACSYFIARHLEGTVEAEGFYEMIRPHIVHSHVYPDGPSWPATPESDNMLKSIVAAKKMREKLLDAK